MDNDSLSSIYTPVFSFQVRNGFQNASDYFLCWFRALKKAEIVAVKGRKFLLHFIICMLLWFLLAGKFHFYF